MSLWYFVFYMEIYATSKKCDEFVVIHDIWQLHALFVKKNGQAYKPKFH